MRSPRKDVLGFTVGALILVSACDVAAQTTPTATEEARALFAQGVEDARDKRWAEALEAFERSNTLVEKPNTLLNLAVLHFRVGQPLESQRFASRFLQVTDPEAAEVMHDRAATIALMDRTRQEIATLDLQVSPTTATMELDGEVVQGVGFARELPLNPGAHVVRFDAREHTSMELQLTVQPGERLRRSIALDPLDPERAAPNPVPSEAERIHEGAPVDVTESDSRLWESPYLWTSVGALALGVSVVLILTLRSADGATAHDDYGGSEMLNL